MNIGLSSIRDGLQLAKRNLAFNTVLVQRDEVYGVTSKIGCIFNVKADVDVNEDVAHVYRMALEHARLSEATSPGSAMACLHYAINAMTEKKTCDNREIVGRKLRRNDVQGLVNHLLDEDDKEQFAKMVELSGANRYLLDRVPAKYDSCQLIEDYEFKHVSRAVEGTVIMDRSLVLVADAYVENVSEIHKLLEYCGTNKERLVIACRGASDDVYHTLAVNRARGTLSAYLLAFPYNLDDANTLVDIAVVTGTDVVSSLKGQLLSTVEPASLQRVETLRLRGNLLSVENPHTVERVQLHARHIKQKLEETEEANRKFLEDRLRRISGATTVVRLKGDLTHALRSERWDAALRTLTSAHRGIRENDDFSVWGNCQYVPITSIATAHTYAYKLMKKLTSIHCFA